MSKIPRVPFYFVRHGQTDWNNEHKIMGSTDIPLNAVGLEQARVVAKNVAHLEISHIVSSPLKRAVQTAKVIAVAMKKPVIVVDGFKECSVGVLEGRCKKDAGVYELVEALKAGGDIEVEGAEHPTTFEARVVAGLGTALEKSSKGKPILIVAHGGVYRVLTRILDAQVPELNAKNCELLFFCPPSFGSSQWAVKVLFE